MLRSQVHFFHSLNHPAFYSVIALASPWQTAERHGSNRRPGLGQTRSWYSNRRIPMTSKPATSAKARSPSRCRNSRKTQASISSAASTRRGRAARTALRMDARRKLSALSNSIPVVPRRHRHRKLHAPDPALLMDRACRDSAGCRCCSTTASAAAPRPALAGPAQSGLAQYLVARDQRRPFR